MPQPDRTGCIENLQIGIWPQNRQIIFINSDYLIKPPLIDLSR
jgi:hypothetical protein